MRRFFLLLIFLSLGNGISIIAQEGRIDLAGDYILSIEEKNTFPNAESELREKLIKFGGEVVGNAIVNKNRYGVIFYAGLNNTFCLEIKDLKINKVIKAEYHIGDDGIEMLRKEPMTKEKDIVDQFNEFILANLLPPELVISDNLKTYSPLKLNRKRNLAKDIETLFVSKNGNKSAIVKGRSDIAKRLPINSDGSSENRPDIPIPSIGIDAVFTPNNTGGYVVESVAVFFSFKTLEVTTETKWYMVVK